MRLTLFLIIFSGFSIFAQELAPPPNVKTPEPAKPHKRGGELISHCYCGREAHYTGGSKAMSVFISRNISFPNDLNWGSIDRIKTYVKFRVQKDGSLSNVHVVWSNFPDANEYIVEVFKRMTNWVGADYPCAEDGTLVRVPVSIEVR